MTYSAKWNEQPLVNDGGPTAQSQHDADPYATLDDLMAVVEALCPEWPQRPALLKTNRMLL